MSYAPAIPSARRGLENLTVTGQSGVTLPALIGGNVFQVIWKVWQDPVEIRKLKSATNEARRQAVFNRYGFIENPKNPTMPLGFLERNGLITMNCLACHAGQIQGKTVLGLPNRNIDLRGFITDLKKLLPGRTILLDKMISVVGPERGILSALGIESASLDHRAADMELAPKANSFGTFTAAVTNVPPWWNMRYKTHIFADATIPFSRRFFITNAGDLFAPKGIFLKQDAYLEDIFAIVDSIEPPAFPGPIDKKLADNGRYVFENSCSKCHGQYDDHGAVVKYPNKVIAIEKIGTDRERAYPSGKERAYDFFKNSWLGENVSNQFRATKGYVAPPLRGVWATAPYLHNGSVPTLWALLHSEQRPKLWQVSSQASDYDIEKVGLVYKALSEFPRDEKNTATTSRIYDTRVLGRGSQGHTFPDELDESEKREVLEYLKTL